MLKYIVAASLVVAIANAIPYGAGKAVVAGPILADAGYGGGYAGPAIISAAIQSKHNIKHYDVPVTGHVQPTTIEVGANVIPLTILFRSASSSLNVKQLHEGQRGSHQETKSEDEPHRLTHQVLKPVIQEVREVIVPVRRITQEITPVQEEVNTLVARGQPALAPAAAPLAGPGPLELAPLDAAGPGSLAGPGPLALAPLEAGLLGPGPTGLTGAVLDDLGYGMRPLKSAPAPLLKKYKK